MLCPHVHRLGITLKLLGSLAACASNTAEITEQDKTAIRTQIDASVRAALAGDWDAWGNTMVPDVVAMPPNHEPLMGRDAAVAYAKAFRG